MRPGLRGDGARRQHEGEGPHLELFLTSETVCYRLNNAGKKYDKKKGTTKSKAVLNFSKPSKGKPQTFTGTIKERLKKECPGYEGEFEPWAVDYKLKAPSPAPSVSRPADTRRPLTRFMVHPDGTREARESLPAVTTGCHIDHPCFRRCAHT